MALGSNGHGARILIADGNFPISTYTPAACRKVFLNLSPGLLSVTDVLKVIKDYIAVETAIVMISPEDQEQQPIHKEFQEILGEKVALKHERRPAFYQEAKSEDTCLAIATGDMRRFGNIILTICSII